MTALTGSGLNLLGGFSACVFLVGFGALSFATPKVTIQKDSIVFDDDVTTSNGTLLYSAGDDSFHLNSRLFVEGRDVMPNYF